VGVLHLVLVHNLEAHGEVVGVVEIGADLTCKAFAVTYGRRNSFSWMNQLSRSLWRVVVIGTRGHWSTESFSWSELLERPWHRPYPRGILRA